MSARPSPTLQHADPAWGTLYALSLARVLITAFVLLSALVFAPPLAGHGASVAGTDIVPGLVAYCTVAVAMALASLYYRRHFFGQLSAQLALDLIWPRCWSSWAAGCAASSWCCTSCRSPALR